MRKFNEKQNRNQRCEILRRSGRWIFTWWLLVPKSSLYHLNNSVRDTSLPFITQPPVQRKLLVALVSCVSSCWEGVLATTRKVAMHTRHAHTQSDFNSHSSEDINAKGVCDICSGVPHNEIGHLKINKDFSPNQLVTAVVTYLRWVNSDRRASLSPTVQCKVYPGLRFH